MRIAVSAVAAVITFWAFVPAPSRAAKGGKDGGGSSNEINYVVWVVDHPGVWPSGSTPANLYAPDPGCPGDTPGTNINYSVRMLDEGDENPCGIVHLFNNGETAPNGNVIRDAVGFIVETSKNKSFLTGVRLKGQDIVGPDGIWHESISAPLTQPVAVPPAESEMILHVHSNILVERYDKHQGGKPVAEAGYVSIGDLIYNAQ